MKSLMQKVAVFFLSFFVMSDAAEKPVPIILDTDIGSAIDDAFALSLVIASDEVELLGVTTCTSQAEDRAWMVCRFLTSVDYRDVPVAFGHDPQPKSPIDWQIQYRRHPAVVWDRTSKPVKESAVELMFTLLRERHEQQQSRPVILAVGPLTNVAALLKEHHECKPWIDRIVLMGGSLHVGYNGKPPAVAEWNIKCDVSAAQAVVNSGVPLVVAPLDVGFGAALNDRQLKKLFAAATPLTWELQSLVQLFEGERPVTLFDPVAVRTVFDESFGTRKKVRLEIDDEGKTRILEGDSNAQAITDVDADKFTNWYLKRVASHGEAVLPKPPGNRTEPIKSRGLPRVVHAFEDYDNDIEKRWWMTGKLETEDLPVESRRACRAVLTQDYDAKMGDSRARYQAVVFNPVPGPPMGSRPRLSFRYKLHGTDILRVQVFSLSNGYHRYLSLAGLPQDEWAEATVDMTEMRRPDGSGGPLAEDERIDDIQFYVDPRAELVIDEMILYDATDEKKCRAFPRRILFTAWFDTGKQGNEWPGEFEIVLHEKPRTWDAARSVVNQQSGASWIRLHMRGQRRLADRVNLQFAYKVTGAAEIKVALVDSETKQRIEQTINKPKVDAWAESDVQFDLSDRLDEMPSADEIQFVLPGKAQLLIDDVLLYVP